MCIAAALLLSSACGVLHEKLESTEVSSISVNNLSSADEDPYSLVAGRNDEEIDTFAYIFNRSKRVAESDTTSLEYCKVEFFNSDFIEIYSNTEDTLTVKDGDKKYTIQNERLARYINDLLTNSK